MEKYSSARLECLPNYNIYLLIYVLLSVVCLYGFDNISIDGVYKGLGLSSVLSAIKFSVSPLTFT